MLFGRGEGVVLGYMYLNYIQLSINKTIKFLWIGHVMIYYQEYILIL